MVAVFPLLGINFVFWMIVGIIRFLVEKISGLRITEKIKSVYNISVSDPSIKHLLSIFTGTLTGVISSITLLSGLFLVFTYVFEVSIVNFFFTILALAIWVFSGFLGGYIAGLIQKQFNTKTVVIVSSLYIIFFLYRFFQNINNILLIETAHLLALGFLFLTSFISVGIGNYFGALLKSSTLPIYIPQDSAIKISPSISPHEVAAIIPAHNEERTIAKTISTLKHVLPANNIFVGSDGSTDKTVEIARSLGARVVDINPNIGKAKVLAYLLSYFNIYEKYKAVIIVDADSEIEDDYLERALPLFDNPGVGAVAVHAMSKWEDHTNPTWSRFFAAYRVRFYRILQAGMRYGQTWKYFNTSPIIPGFASIYRISSIKNIEIDAPNLIIEDYNMTFELHHKKLGTIGYSPKIHGISQDPVTLRDYVKQVTRWNLGFWQTVRRHGIWPSIFWLNLGTFLIEMLIFSVVFLVLPILLIFLLINPGLIIMIPFFLTATTFQLTILGTIVALFLLDYLMTIIVAIYEKKPVLLKYGLGFFFLRYIDTFIFLYTLPLAFITKSTGKWKSPKRMALETS